jgi:hypothetical protein
MKRRITTTDRLHLALLWASLSFPEREELVAAWQAGTDDMLTPKEHRDLILWDFDAGPQGVRQGDDMWNPNKHLEAKDRRRR